MEFLGFYKVHPDAHPLSFGTEDAACFDIAASLIVGETYKRFSYHYETHKTLKLDLPEITLAPFSRTMVPTNLILDIPKGYSVRIHPRSGLSWKRGIVLANMEGVIDADYVDPLFILLFNVSGTPQTIKDGDRIAQGELVELPKYNVAETQEKPARYGDRVGGFGSTGV